jgi:UDP-2,4-diacetamido-2,4,6-trideoxy-beta-L-altropyranose hydrolase
MIGSGHLVRCRALARECKEKGAEIFFICREQQGHLTRQLDADGFNYFLIPSYSKVVRNEIDGVYSSWLGVSEEEDAIETVRFIRQVRPDWVVVDHYGLGVRWESLIRNETRKIMAIDDLANRKHDCDVLLDPNFSSDDSDGRYDSLISEHCTRLFGPMYALISPEYKVIRSTLPEHDGEINRVLVYFGASDDRNLSSVVSIALKRPDLSDLLVDLVLGVNSSPSRALIQSLEGRGRVRFHQSLPTLAGLMARADLMIGAAGGTTWERAALGLPGLVGALTENQRRLIDPMLKLGATFFMPHEELTCATSWADRILFLRQRKLDVRRAHVAARQLTDGCGLARVSDVLFKFGP